MNSNPGIYSIAAFFNAIILINPALLAQVKGLDFVLTHVNVVALSILGALGWMILGLHLALDYWSAKKASAEKSSKEW